MRLTKMARQRIEIISANIPELLGKITREDIQLSDITSVNEITIQVSISTKDYVRINDLIKFNGSTCNVIQKSNSVNDVLSCIKRPILPLTIIVRIVTM